MRVSRNFRIAGGALLSLVLAACGGGGNGGGITPPPTVTISGDVGYEFVPVAMNCQGLDFAATSTRPIRGATVQLLDAASGTEISRTTSSATGGYSFPGIQQNRMVQIRVRAELKDSGSPGWDVEIRDNFIAGASDADMPPPPTLTTRALYALDSAAFSSGTAGSTRNLTAATGWDGASYSGARAAAPFAMLDTIYEAMQFVRAADPNANFVPLDLYWSVNNTIGSSFDLTAGEIGSTGFAAGVNAILVLGDAAVDTDEFDAHIIAHEWGHFFEATLSRSDSEGRSHFLGESLDAAVAFSEGFASAFGSMILNNPINCDTGVPGTNSGFGFSTEGNSFGTAGWFNEVSVATLVYDLWDTANDGVDAGSIGFGPIYDTMAGPQVTTDAFATLFSFATELRASLGAADAALLDALLTRENIVAGVALDIWGTNETNDAGVAQDVFPLYTDYTADGTVLNICVNSQLDGLARHGNNVAENRYLRVTIPNDDEYDVSVVTTTATPVSPDPDDRDQSDPDVFVIRGSGPENVGTGTSAADNMETFRSPNEAGGPALMLAAETYIIFLEEWRFEDAGASTTYPQRICFDVSLTPTP